MSRQAIYCVFCHAYSFAQVLKNCVTVEGVPGQAVEDAQTLLCRLRRYCSSSTRPYQPCRSVQPYGGYNVRRGFQQVVHALVEASFEDDACRCGSWEVPRACRDSLVKKRESSFACSYLTFEIAWSSGLSRISTSVEVPTHSRFVLVTDIEFG